MSIKESYKDKIVRMAKEKDLLYGHIYFCDELLKEKYGVYATFNGFVISDCRCGCGLKIPIQTREDPYEIVLIHPSEFREFQDAF